MKAHLILCGLLVLVLISDFAQISVAETEMSAIVKYTIGKCAKSTSVPVEQVEHFMPAKAADLDNFTHNMKCFLLCLYRKMDLITYDDHPNHELFGTLMEKRFAANKDKVKPALAKCMTIDDKDPCEEVYKFEVCMLQNVQG
ncbi:uncharacterized protein [Musca autumnalis]|uniref:uncharacterized protein n=1 Tax=Musca autumnalis TaxID=221902 RepID=UPI003CEAEC8A